MPRPIPSLPIPTDLVARVKRLQQQIESFGCFEILESKIGKPATAKQLDAARVGDGPLHADLRSLYEQCDGVTLRWRFNEEAEAAAEAFRESYPEDEGEQEIDFELKHGFSFQPLATLTEMPWELHDLGDGAVAKALKPLDSDQLLKRCALFDHYEPDGEDAGIVISSEHLDLTLVALQEGSGSLMFDGPFMPLGSYVHLVLASGGEIGERHVLSHQDEDNEKGIVKVSTDDVARLRRRLMRY